MKKYLLSMSLVLLAGAPAFAGGVFCKECPAETDKCIPICAENTTKSSKEKCTNDTAILDVLKPKTQTAAGACCSWGPNIQGCWKGC